jgi:hypothetical protein
MCTVTEIDGVATTFVDEGDIDDLGTTYSNERASWQDELDGVDVMRDTHVWGCLQVDVTVTILCFYPYDVIVVNLNLYVIVNRLDKESV